MPLERDEDIKSLLEGTRTIAMIGASDAGTPPAAGDGEDAAIFRELARKLLVELGQSAGGFHAAHQ